MQATQSSTALERTNILSESNRKDNESNGTVRSGSSADTNKSKFADKKHDVEKNNSLLHMLVVDDDEAIRTTCCSAAEELGFTVARAGSLAKARTILKHRKIDLILLDLKLPDGEGLRLLEQVKALYPDTSVVVMTAFATVSSAVKALRIGAIDYLTKPFALEELTALLLQAGKRSQFDVESRLLRERLRKHGGTESLIGQSPEMEKLFRILSKVAFSNHPVLILGESGTGKEIAARSIHFNSPNANKPFVPVDCKSLVPSVIESQLFGHVKGAYTGAECNKDGLLSSAQGGTVFLDEIGELPPELQTKLLRALQEKVIRPVGSTQPLPLSARVLAATNRDLVLMVEQGKFRKDLYFRLNVVTLRIPPLRSRREDIPLLATYFLERMQKLHGTSRTIPAETMDTLRQHDWPGNVRELEQAIERAWTFSSDTKLNVGDLPTQLQNIRLPAETLEASIDRPHAPEIIDRGGSKRITSIAEMEKHAILGTIRQLNGDKLKAAKLLGIGKTTLYRKLKEYGITEELSD